ncbi:MAG: hypothetical protein ACRD1Q_16025 [Vicinamibacterales bacterium]
MRKKIRRDEAWAARFEVLEDRVAVNVHRQKSRQPVRCRVGFASAV